VDTYIETVPSQQAPKQRSKSGQVIWTGHLDGSSTNPELLENQTPFWTRSQDANHINGWFFPQLLLVQHVEIPRCRLSKGLRAFAYRRDFSYHASMHFHRRPKFIRTGDKDVGPVLRQTQACCNLGLDFTRGRAYKRHKERQKEKNRIHWKRTILETRIHHLLVDVGCTSI